MRDLLLARAAMGSKKFYKLRLPLSLVSDLIDVGVVVVARCNFVVLSEFLVKWGGCWVARAHYEFENNDGYNSESNQRDVFFDGLHYLTERCGLVLVSHQMQITNLIRQQLIRKIATGIPPCKAVEVYTEEYIFSRTLEELLELSKTNNIPNSAYDNLCLSLADSLYSSGNLITL